jgi:hypothetical protein
MPSIAENWRRQFRPGKSAALKGALVERSLWALSQPGEKQEITMRGLAALADPFRRKRKTTC